LVYRSIRAVVLSEVVGFDLLEQVEQGLRGLGIAEVLAGLQQRPCCGVELADTEQVIAEQELEVGVEGVEVGLFGELLDVLEQFLFVGVEAAGVEDGLLIG